jgi:hypothetical protein
MTMSFYVICKNNETTKQQHNNTTTKQQQNNKTTTKTTKQQQQQNNNKTTTKQQQQSGVHGSSYLTSLSNSLFVILNTACSCIGAAPLTGTKHGPKSYCTKEKSNMGLAPTPDTDMSYEWVPATVTANVKLDTGAVVIGWNVNSQGKRSPIFTVPVRGEIFT